MGAHFGETGILTAAGILFAALAGPLTAAEGGLGAHLLEYDPRVSPMQIDAEAAISLPAAPRPGNRDIDTMMKQTGEAANLVKGEVRMVIDRLSW